MMSQEEIKHRELLARTGAGNGELHEAQARGARQRGRIKHERRRIADDGRVETGIPRKACHRGVGVAVVDAVNPEQAELAAVIGIDHDHESEQKQGADRERPDAGRQAAGPLGRTIRI